MYKLTEQDGRSLDMVSENLEALKAIFPEAFTEDGVDFEVLRQLLGDAVAEGEEKYGLTWHGKKKARQIALMPSLGTLRPCKEESVDWDTTQNLFIEGDNLEVLKLLQKSYANKIKMIYIDPPYNTGKEFIYPDKFQDNLDTYLKYTGQKDDEGFKVSSNTESSGRYHTNWLNMMYPRLKLARSLLKDDGVIFISIDDTEQSNLKTICNEIFGEENFFADLVVIRAEGGGLAKRVVKGHDNLLVYVKSLDTFKGIFRPKDIRGKIITENGRQFWIEEDWLRREFGKYGTCLYEEIEQIKGKEKKEEIDRGIDTGIYRLIKKENGHIVGRLRALDEDGSKFYSVLKHLNKGGIKCLEDLGLSQYFDFPKPLSLTKEIVLGATIFSKNSNDIILDFFAGSATTAHAVMQLNAEDGGNRKFIMVQLPEPCEEKSEAFKAGYKTIAEIGKERIRRAAAKIREELTTKGTKNTKEENVRDFRVVRGSKELDLGFKVFKLDISNIRAWNPDRNDLEQTLIDHIEHLVEGRSEEDVLYELLLKRGVDLTVPIEERIITTKGTKNTKEENVRDFRVVRGSKKVFSIGYGVLFACLATKIKKEEVEDLAEAIIAWHRELEPACDTQVVFRDSAFDGDIAKTNMTAILEQNKIKHVRSL